MTDYPELYQRLAREIIARGEIVDGDTLRLAKRVQFELKAQGYPVDTTDIPAIQAYFDGARAGIAASLDAAFVLAAAELPAVRSATVAERTAAAFDARWPDGLSLSDRLWDWQQETKRGLTQVLRDGVNMGRAVDGIVMDMQRTIERTSGGQRFKVVQQHAPDWVEALHEAATHVIHTPDARQDWLDAVEKAQEHIDGLSLNGSRRAGERALDQIKKAVAKGREDLLDKAVKWWTYDKQLYDLKRIARTEMSTAMHQAVIEGADADDTVIGYQWRLSASHPVTDICDYYAGIEMGLGKGVWTKDTVPRHKAHPHCMCLLIPRVTPIGRKGDKNYATFIKNLAPEKRRELLPKWAGGLNALGMPLDKLIRPDGLGLMTRQAIAEKLGEERFNAANALGKALNDKKWPVNKIKPNNRMSRQTLDALQAHAETPEVTRFLARLDGDQYSVSSREWHYFKYKYQYGQSLKSAADIDTGFDAVLKDPESKIFRTGERYIVHSDNADRWAIIQPNGQRITAYTPTQDELDAQGKPLWLIRTLID